jgi:uncharacterized protein (DUF934 family)
MASLIRRGCIANESWRLLDANELATWLARGPQADSDAGGVLIPLPAWRAHAAEVLAGCSRFGIVLEAGDDPADIADQLDRIPVVAVRFARFADGRGYSIARLLRGRHGYRGELRAIGDVLTDQIFYMKRVGFDAFALRADQDPATALAALGTFSEAYQAAIEPALPLFRRRAA